MGGLVYVVGWRSWDQSKVNGSSEHFGFMGDVVTYNRWKAR
jgi:hypothetical protein